MGLSLTDIERRARRDRVNDALSRTGIGTATEQVDGVTGHEPEHRLGVSTG